MNYWPDTFDSFGDKESLVLYKALRLLKEVSDPDELEIVSGFLKVLKDDLKSRGIDEDL